MSEPTPRKIFISYRRADHGDFVERIRDWLVNRYGRDNVFMDFDSIPPFVTFEDFIEERTTAADAVIVIIGPRWIELMRERTENGEDDYVLFEVAAALRLSKVIAPILIKGGVMPTAADLPVELRPLRKINAPSLDSGKAFLDNIGHIIDGIERVLAHREQKPQDQSPADLPQTTSPVKAQPAAPVNPPTHQTQPVPPSPSQTTQPAPIIPTDQNALDTTSMSADELYKRAMELKSQERDRDGMKLINQAIEKNPKEARYYELRGDLYTKDWKYELAVKEYDEAIRLTYDSRHHRSLYRIRGKALYYSGKYDDAILSFTEAIKLGDNYVYDDRANAKRAKGDYKGAIEDLSSAMKIVKDSSFLHLERAALYERLGHWHLALNDYQKAKKFDPYRRSFDSEISELKQKLRRR